MREKVELSDNSVVFGESESADRFGKKCGGIENFRVESEAGKEDIFEAGRDGKIFDSQFLRRIFISGGGKKKVGTEAKRGGGTALVGVGRIIVLLNKEEGKVRIRERGV